MADERALSAGLVDIALAAQQVHIFATPTRCVCGYEPSTGPDWERHRMEAALGAVLDACDVRVEYGVREIHDDGTARDRWDYLDRAGAEEDVAYINGSSGWQGSAQLVCRLRLTGPAESPRADAGVDRVHGRV